jgi:hypothetical protein
MAKAKAKEETAPEKATDIKPRKKLFLDDYEIEKMQGLERKLHPPVKYAGNPVLKCEHRWEDVCVQTRVSPQWVPEEKVWKTWYNASETRWAGEPEAGHMCYAFSSDGIHWEKPLLGVYNYHGSDKNNIMGKGTPENLVYDAHEVDSSRRYKGLAGGLGRVPVVSADGIRWKETGAPKIESGDESFMTYDETSGQYLATVKVFRPSLPGRCVALATSKDFWNWTKPELIFHSDERDQVIGRERTQAALADPNRLVPIPAHVVPAKFRTDIYNMAVFPYEGLYLGLPSMFDQTGPTPDGNQDGTMYVELVVSRDLKNWQRVADRGVFIGLGPKGSYDCGMICPAGRPILRDKELWFYYNGFSVTHEATTPTVATGGICLAKLRLDGFVSLEAGNGEGSLLTKPLVLTGKRLFINADVPQGRIQAEIVDENDQAIPGFAAAKCIPFRGDNIKGEIKWKGKDDLSKLIGKKARIRFLLRNASLYAFWIGE